MPLLEQPQMADVDILRQHIPLLVHRLGRRNVDDELLIEQRLLENPRVIKRGDDEAGIQQVLFQAVDEDFGSQLGDFQTYSRIFLQEALEEQRQEVRRNRRQDPQPELSHDLTLALTRHLREPLHLFQDDARLLDDLYPLGRRHDGGFAAVEDLHTELGLNLLELHAEGRLGDKTLAGGCRKMPPRVYRHDVF